MCTKTSVYYNKSNHATHLKIVQFTFYSLDLELVPSVWKQLVYKINLDKEANWKQGSQNNYPIQTTQVKKPLLLEEMITTTLMMTS